MSRLAQRRLRGYNDRRRGVVLIMVLVVVMLLSLSAYTFTDMMVTEREAVDLSGRRVQAAALAESCLDQLRIFLAQDKATQVEAGGVFDNPDLFRGVLVIDDLEPLERGRFTVLAPALDPDGYIAGVRFGLQNESARLNLNVITHFDGQQAGIGRQLLMALPGMTEDMADAILDWLDEDDQQRDFGAEREYYSGLNPPYAPKNGPLETVEELLLVRGMTPGLLFGLDSNRNGIVDPHESDGQSVDGVLELGWSAYLTLYSLESNTTAAGLPRVYLNEEDMQTLSDQLHEVMDPDWANFIVAYRMGKDYNGNEDGEAAGNRDLDLTKKGERTLTQVFDLIGKKVEVTFDGDEEPTILESPFPDSLLAMASYMPELVDVVTVNKSKTIPGRININQAPRAILEGIPSITPDIVDQIINQRTAESDSEDLGRMHETWLLTEGIVTLDEMKLLSPMITAGGDVYRAQVVGYFEGGGASARNEAIIDATKSLPRLLFWRDISHLGRGFSLETLGIEAVVP